MNEPIKLIAEAVPTNDGVWAVAVRPAFIKRWEMVSIGPGISKRDAETVAIWLNAAWPELDWISRNLAGGGANGGPR